MVFSAILWPLWSQVSWLPLPPCLWISPKPGSRAWSMLMVSFFSEFPILQYQHKIFPGVPEYKGAGDVLGKVIKKEGFFALWKGFTPYYFRLGPHTVLTFIFLEQANIAYKLHVLGIEGGSGGLWKYFARTGQLQTSQIPAKDLANMLLLLIIWNS